MKKQSLSFIFATSTLFMATLVGCSLEKKEEVKANHYAAPVYEVVDGEVKFSSEADRVLLVKVDDGDWHIQDGAKLSTEVGHHEVLAKVSHSPVEETAEIASFEYDVKEVSLDINKDAYNKASWEAVGAKILVDGVESGVESYTAIEDGDAITIKALGGFDADTNTYYVGSAEESVKFTFPKLVIEDCTDKTSADLADDWSIKKYSSGWVNTSASIAEANGEVVFKAWNNYTTFRYSKSYSTSDEFNVLAFDLTGNKNSQIKVQLMSSKYGVYATYNLGKVPAATHIELAMDDANWKVNGTSAALKDSLTTFGLKSTNEAIKAFDMVNFIIYGESSNGENCQVKLDNLIAKMVAEAKSGFELIPQKDLVFNFEETSGSGKYAATNWTQTQYTSSWVDMSNQMNCKVNGSNKFINVYGGWSTTYKYVYNKDGASLGTFKKASIDLGNWYNNPQAMNIEFIITDVNGKDYGLLGSYNQSTYASTWYSMPATNTNEFKHFDFDLTEFAEAGIEIKSFRILTKSSKNDNVYLYIDNIVFSN